MNNKEKKAMSAEERQNRFDNNSKYKAADKNNPLPENNYSPYFDGINFEQQREPYMYVSKLQRFSKTGDPASGETSALD